MINQTACGSTLEPRVPEINEAENRLDKAIQTLNDNTAQFIDRVSAVLRTSDPSCQEAIEKAPDSTVKLALEINGFARRIENINSMVMSAIGRVEI